MPHHIKHYLHQKNKILKGDLLNRICMIFSVLMPMMSIPQIYLLYSTKDAGSLSLLMWVSYSVGIIPFLVYGFVHKIYHLIILNILWLLAQTTIIVGIILYS